MTPNTITLTASTKQMPVRKVQGTSHSFTGSPLNAIRTYKSRLLNIAASAAIKHKSLMRKDRLTLRCQPVA